MFFGYFWHIPYFKQCLKLVQLISRHCQQYILMRIKNQSFLYAISVIISFGSFVFGYALVCISMMSQHIQRANAINEEDFHFQLSFITTLLPLGAFLGSFLMQPMSNHFGENKAMFILDVFAIISILLQAYSVNILTLYIGRFLLGIYVGISSGIIPVYLVSISPPEVSGIIGSFNQLLITIGIAAAYGLGILGLQWSTYMFIPAFFCLARLASLLFFKFDRLERHFNNEDTEILKDYIGYFYEDCSVEQLRRLRMSSYKQQQVSEQRKEGQGCIGTLTGNASISIIKIGLVFAIANQFSGINAILFYAKQVFDTITGGDKALSDKYTYYLGVLQVIITLGAGFLINKFGRRTLMLLGQTIVVGSLLLGYFFQHLLNEKSLIIYVVFTHIIGFSISLGPISMVYVAQVMQNITLVVCSVWIFTLFVSMVSQIMITTYGIGNVFLFYGLVSFFCLIYMTIHMVQSKGLSRKELVAKYQGNKEEHEMVTLEEEREGKEDDKIDSA